MMKLILYSADRRRVHDETQKWKVRNCKVTNNNKTDFNECGGRGGVIIYQEEMLELILIASIKLNYIRIK